MRMHTHGKCSPNIILGALTVFCVIVLYNYWTLSTFNRDLILKEHNLEQQIISLSRTNDALQANLEKVEEIKDKVENNLKREILVDQKAKEEITEKDSRIKSLLNDLENSKQAAQNCKDDLASTESKIQIKDKEITELKAKVTSLEAQLVEKNNKLSRTEKELVDAQKLLIESSSKGNGTVKFTPAKAPPVLDTAAQQVDQAALAVEVDPAAPYPRGWMDHGGGLVKPGSKIHVSIKNEGNRGIVGHGSPVLIFDDPKLPRAKARFSVLDRPKNEMRPDAAVKQPESLPKPQAQGDPNNGGEDFADPGVLPVPGSQDAGDDKKHRNDINKRAGNGAPNLDAAEDDRDGPLKEDFGGQDDQSPDGDLPQKENGALQAPESLKHQNERLVAAAEVEQQRHDPFDNHL